MRAIFRLTLIAVLVYAQGCSTNMSMPDKAYLHNYETLAVKDGATASSLRPSVVIDPSRIAFEDIDWRADPSSCVSEDEQTQLLVTLREELQQRIGELPLAPEGKSAKLRAAVTRIETVSPSLNVLSTLLVFLPLDRGGAVVEIEVVDPDTGEQLAALRQGYFAPLSDFTARFSKLAPANIAVSKAVDDFVHILQPTASVALNAAK